ncbi:aldehyde dehydrogenase family protein, partial [Dietzia sp. UBA5065]
MSRPTARVYDRLRDLVAIPEFRADPSSRPSTTIAEVFTGEPLAEIPVGTAHDVTAAVARARAAQIAWSERAPEDRVAVLTRFATQVMRNRDQLMDIVQAETGKSRSSAQEEVLDCLITARHYARTAPGLLAPKRVQGMLPGLTKAVVRRQPKGVVGVIAPWNYPLNLAATDALAALAAGNAVVIKPASITPFCALAAA